MTKLVSNDIPDWTRLTPATRDGEPCKQSLASLLAYQRYRHGSGAWASLLARCCLPRQRNGCTGSAADDTLNGRIGGELLISKPNDIVIHPNAQIGANCLIMQQVTLHAKTSDVLQCANWRHSNWRVRCGQEAQP